MKFKTLVITLLFAAGALSSVAIAKGPPPGKGKNKSSSSTTSTTKGKGKNKAGSSALTCKRFSVVLKGEFVSAGEDSFKMEVKQSNAHGRSWVGDEAEVDVDSKTKFRRRGPAELEDFEQGDWLNVQARSCQERSGNSTSGSTTTTSSTPAEDAKLVARRVVGKPAKNAESEDGSTTTTASG